MKTSAVRTAIKNTRAAITEGKKDEASKLFTTAQSLISKLAKSSALNKKTAARYTSRLQQAVNKA